LTIAELHASERSNIDDHDQENVRALLKRVLGSDGFVGSPRLCELLEYLVIETLEGRGERVKGFTIAQEVFNRTDPEDAQTSTIVSVEARRLRRKLEDYYANEGQGEAVKIKIPKGTYVPIFVSRSDLEEASIQNNEYPASTKSTSFLNKSSWPHSGIVIAILLIALLIPIALWLTGNLRTGTTVTAKPLLVVLPFNNLTSDPDHDVYAYGLTEDLTSALSRFSELDVIANSSVTLLANKPISLEDVASKFGATHAVYGTLRGKDPKYRVSVELVDTSTGKLVWANRFDKDLADPLKTQFEIGNSVARALPVTLSNSALVAQVRSYQPSLDTKALFEQAMDLANPPSDPHRLRLAESVFNKVVDADPNFAGGYAGLAYIEAFKGLFLVSSSLENTASKTINLANLALEQEPTNALALNALAFAKLISGNFSEAVEASGRAIKFNPNDPYAFAYHGFILAANGDPKSGIPFVERALALDPLEARTPYLNILGTVKFQSGDYRGAIDAFKENQDRSGPNGPGTRATLAASLMAIENREAALEVLETLPPGYVDGRWLEWRLLAFRTKEAANKGPEFLAQLEMFARK
jgi:TolB-like protein/Tfp pilus assembly protein PilF